MFWKHLSLIFSSIIRRRSLMIFFFEITVSSKLLRMWTKKSEAILLTAISFMGSCTDFTTSFLSLASKTLKKAQATYRPYFEASKEGSFSFIVSASHFIFSISVYAFT